jgi:hypothetical protein
MKYYAICRFTYINTEGKKTTAAANSVISDLDDAEGALATERGYLREATVGEAAEALASEPPKTNAHRKKSAAPPAVKPADTSAQDQDKTEGSKPTDDDLA